MEIVNASKTDIGKTSVAKTGRKVATVEDRLSKKIVASGLCNFWPVATIDSGVIAKLEEG